MAKAVIYDRHGNPLEDDDVVPDGGFLRVPLPFRDAMSAAARDYFRRAAALPAVHDGLGRAAGHRTGFVFGPRELTADAATAYAERSALLRDAWRQPASPGRSRDCDDDRKDARDRGNDPATRDAAAAYAAYVSRISNAWRTGG